MQTLLQASLLPLLILAAIGTWLYVRHQHIAAKLAQWEEAYRRIEQQLDERTQKLRNINNMLYGEISQHEMTEEKLRKAQNYLRSIINSMPSVLISVTEDGTITHWNSSAERATELSDAEVAGKYLWEAYPNLPVSLETIRQAIDNGTPQVMESTRLESRGETYFTDITVYPLIAGDNQEAVIRIDDVTLRITMENMMIQNEKLRSLGELAAGMAHEINNPLGAILQSVQNMERRLSTDLPRNHETANELGLDIAAMRRYLEAREIPGILQNIRNAGERSARIVANMLGFARSSRQHAPADLNALLMNCLELLEHRFEIPRHTGPLRIQVNTELAPDLPAVPCASPEIQQVLLNLLRNATQALAADVTQTAPAITISTGFDDEQVWIRIVDNGPGMDEDVIRHVFEPFFTTKEVGQGTGLGMSISYFIITEHHGGNIDIDSSPGNGACFTVRLPLQSPLKTT